MYSVPKICICAMEESLSRLGSLELGDKLVLYVSHVLTLVQ